DWLRENAGSEKVVRELIHIFREEDLEFYTLFNTLLKPDEQDILQGIHSKTSVLQWVPSIQRIYKSLLPVLPLFIKAMAVRKSDVYITSSHAVAKGISVPENRLHICYCHTPMRYAWFLYDDYIKELHGFKKAIIRLIMPFIKRWDLKTARRVDYFIANSKHIQQHISTIYGRPSTVIYPPVRKDLFQLNRNPRQNYYLAVGRFVPYKKMDILIDAFKQMPDKKLVMIGEGYAAKKAKTQIGQSANIIWLGYQHVDELILYMQNAKACLFAAKEDFGIMCVEAQLTGTPVIALNYGGYKETVLEGVTGYFFGQQNAESVRKAVEQFEHTPLSSHETIHRHAIQFSDERFREELKNFIAAKYKEFYGKASI
ncbi:MAG TPA: glycosyltransferase, partial [Chitinophagaceae bacterium]|nr:glycosyltransferase [Chitinophagaceae bacterium]